MKKLWSLLIIASMLLFTSVSVFAEENEPEFRILITANGNEKINANTDDVITIFYTLERTDSDEDYMMYGMQNEIRYDSRFFELVEGSELVSAGIETNDIAMRDHNREFYMNFVSFGGGEVWKANTTVGSFQLRVIGKSGSSEITCQDYQISVKDGSKSRPCTANSITVTVSEDCVVEFESNGGSRVKAQTVPFGGHVVKPEDPVLKGYHVESWCTDVDLKANWDFEKDTVDGNMTLYAKWAEGGPGFRFRIPAVVWWILAVLAALSALYLGIRALLGRNRCTITFDPMNGRDAQKVKQKKKTLIQSPPADPVNGGFIFTGWYRDEACTKQWDMQWDIPAESMTLYAGWTPDSERTE